MSDELFGRLMGGRAGRQRRKVVHRDIMFEKLRSAHAELSSSHTFQAGDIVERKPSTYQDNPSNPPSGLYAVMQVFHITPSLDPTDEDFAASHMNLMLGYYDNDDDFMMTLSDSRFYIMADPNRPARELPPEEPEEEPT